MEEIFKQLLDEEFEGLRGSKLEGTLRFSDELANGLIGNFIGKENQAASSSDSAGGALSYSEAMKYIRVEKLEWKTEQGRAAISIKASI